MRKVKALGAAIGFPIGMLIGGVVFWIVIPGFAWWLLCTLLSAPAGGLIGWFVAKLSGPYILVYWHSREGQHVRWTIRREARWLWRKTNPPLRGYEELIVFDDDDDDIFRVAVPVGELYKELGHNSRYINDSKIADLVGAMLGYMVGTLISGLACWFIFNNLIVTAFFSMFFGAPLFIFPGWWFGKRYAPRPQWLARKIGGEVIPIDTEAYFHPDDPEASFVAEMMAGRDVKFVLAGGKNREQQLALMTLVILVIALIVALFFFVNVFSG